MNTYINLSGCDSVHTLNLNIYPSLTAYIDQLGDSLLHITNPIGLNATLVVNMLKMVILEYG